MSLKQLTRVFHHSKQKGGRLLTLLAIADNAKDSGYAFPGIATIAKKTRLSERQVIRNLQEIEADKELVVDRTYHYNRYILAVFDPDSLRLYDDPYCEKCGLPEIEQLGLNIQVKKDKYLCPICFTQDKNPHIGVGDIMSPQNIGVVLQLRDILSPILEREAKLRDILSLQGDISDKLGDMDVTRTVLTDLNQKDKKIFKNLLNQIGSETNKAEFNKWVRPLQFAGRSNGFFMIQCETDYQQLYMKARYLSSFQRHLAGHYPPDENVTVLFTINQE